MPLTEELVAWPETKQAYHAATHHPFLEAAGKLALSREQLAAWLTQDRLYALSGYTSFLGLLISKLPSSPESGPDTEQSRRHRRRLAVLAGAMANIDREVGFFEETAKENGLDLATRSLETRGESAEPGLANAITRGYIDYMIAVASRQTFEEALVLLWAMERLYLDAWTFAASHLPSTAEQAKAAQQPGAARALLALIPNWSSAGFAQFVKDIAALVDELGIDINAANQQDTPSSLHDGILAVWKTTLWYEERFWRAGGDIDRR